MVERLRELADRPLDRRVARAVLISGLAVTIGVSLLVGLATVGRADGPRPGGTGPDLGRPVSPAPTTPARAATAKPEQDPQDRRASAAHRRAVSELRSHRALQHVPYRHEGVTVTLVGARGSRAVLRVTAPTTEAARTGWRNFLRRFQDRGTAYLPVFRGGRERG